MLYLVYQLWNVMLLGYILGVLSIVVIISTVNKAPLLYRSVGLVFLLLGIIVVWTEDLLSLNVLMHFNSLMGLLALFFVLPFMNAIIRIGRYDRTLSRMIGKKTNDVGTLYKKTSFATYVLTVFLNVATVPIIVSSVRDKLKDFGTAFSQVFLRTVSCVPMRWFYFGARRRFN